jgi:hypothetical protein
MATGVFGCPLKSGNSNKNEPGVWVDGAVPAIGKACTLVGTDSNGNSIIKPFDGKSLFGFVSANDFNTRSKTLSVQRAGYSVPVFPADGAVFAKIGDPVGVNASGELVPAASAVYVINGELRIITATAIDKTFKPKPAVVIDFELGGAVSTPA